MATKIGIISGSVRKNSLGTKIFNYMRSIMPDTAEVTYEWINLADFNLPMYGLEQMPLGGEACDLNAEQERWIGALERQDGLAVLAPEYDHAIPGSLKNAIDYIGTQVDHKPLLIITYSHSSDGGMLAAESMVEIFQMLRMMVLPKPVLLRSAHENFDENGSFIEDAPSSEHFKLKLARGFDELVFYSKLMAENPYTPTISK